jgi:hypothetical protein
MINREEVVALAFMEEGKIQEVCQVRQLLTGIQTWHLQNFLTKYEQNKSFHFRL